MKINASLNIILHANQERIHNSPARFKVVKAGKRFGKTKLALFEILKAAGSTLNGTFWYIAPTYRQAKNIAWWDLNWLLPKQLVRRSVENELMKELISGSRVQLMGADNEDALRGPELNGVVFDEAAYTKEHIWSSIVRGQLLGKDAEKRFAYFISSPNDRGRNWYSSFYEDAVLRKRSGDKDWDAFYYTIWDNPTLNRGDIEKMRDQTTDDTWNVEYMAIESAHSGQIYSEFNFSKHVMEYKHPKDVIPLLVRGLDWGIDHPTTCLMVEIDVKNKMLYVRDEFVKSGFVIQESCSAIKHMTGESPVEWSVIDPSTNKRNPQTGRTDKDEFQRWGIPCLPGDNRDRGYDITKMFFKRNMIRVHPKCRNLIFQLKNLQYGDKTGDDCTDPLRYICVRIHDYMFGGIFNPAENSREFTPAPQGRECNINDPRMFPKPKGDFDNWVLQELEAG